MRAFRRSFVALLLLVLAASPVLRPDAALAASAAEIDARVDAALEALLASEPAAKALAGQAKGILVFPQIIKAGLIVGGALGEGALRVGGQTQGYYNSVAASYGLQAGAESFSYALFFMSDQALDHLKTSAGWEIGVGPTVVLVDKGAAAKLSTTTAQEGIYAFIYGQQGLMAGLGIEGSKITEITPDQ